MGATEMIWTSSPVSRVPEQTLAAQCKKRLGSENEEGGTELGLLSESGSTVGAEGDTG